MGSWPKNDGSGGRGAVTPNLHAGITYRRPPDVTTLFSPPLRSIYNSMRMNAFSCSRSLAFCSISSYSILFHLIPSYSILFHPIPSYSIVRHSIPLYFIARHSIASSSNSFHTIPSYSTNCILFHPLPHIPFYFILFHSTYRCACAPKNPSSVCLVLTGGDRVGVQ